MKTQNWAVTLTVMGAVVAGTSGCGGAEDGQPPREPVATQGAGLADCTTRIAYGDRWIGRENGVDVASGSVTWDGTCINEGSNSYAVLSNGWKPYFTGKDACVMALDTTCAGAGSCSTRLTYNSAWIHSGEGTFDDTGGRVFWDRACTNQSPNSYAMLSNGWKPFFTGSNSCGVSLRYSGCGGLYQNPVFPSCADPGVIQDGSQYIAACTGGDFALRTSKDLVTWTDAGKIFSTSTRPTWAKGDFWAPEIHKVGSRYIAYFTARHTNGALSIGAATATSALGPYKDLGWPLVNDTSMGMIDATLLKATNGTLYLVWKADGNAAGKKTPIYGQQLSADGLSLVGSRTQLITNDQGWEGGVVEGPWVVARDGYYYLFYSGNAYYDGRYAIGVARATNPMGPYTKASAPILKTVPAWEGPGHGSAVTSPAGQSVMVYHAWNADHTTRAMLVDPIIWSGGWPSMPSAPSEGSRPMP